MVSKKYQRDSELRHDLTLYDWSAPTPCSWTFRDATKVINATGFELDGNIVRSWARLALYGEQVEKIEYDDMGRPAFMRQVSQERGKKSQLIEHAADYSTSGALALVRGRVNGGAWIQVFPRAAHGPR